MHSENRATHLDTDAEGMESSNVESLQAEVTKWQERVPKLAAALRTRTEELTAAREQIRELQRSSTDQPATADARLKARDEHIAELEEQFRDLTQRHRELSGELHTARLDITSAQQERDSWKKKWQRVNDALDEEAGARSATAQDMRSAQQQWAAEREQLCQAHDERLEQLDQELTSLRGRNQNLKETTELANKQIATLGEELTQLLAQVDDERQKAVASQSALEALQTELSQVREDAAARSRAHEDELETLRSELAATARQVEESRAELARAQEAGSDLQRQVGELQKSVEDKDAELATRAKEAEAFADGLSARDRKVDLAREQLTQLQDALADTQAELKDMRAREDVHVARVAELEAGAQQLTESLVAAQQSLADASAAAAVKDETAQRQVAELEAEVERLTACIDDAQRSQDRWRDERQNLLGTVETVQQDNQRLTARLEERSALVRELEQECDVHGQSTRHLEDSREQLEERLGQANRKAETFEAHARGLEDRLASHQRLMEALEQELSDTKTAHVAAAAELKAELKQARSRAVAAAADAERVAELQEELRELEAVFRERTEELDDLKWRLKQEQNQPDENVVMVLNQQLKDSRDECQRLRDKLAKADPGVPIDDLTLIKGVGEKLAAQLAEQGFATLAQVAELDEEALQQEDHCLYPYRSRIARDEWVKQARQLLTD